MFGKPPFGSRIGFQFQRLSHDKFHIIFFITIFLITIFLIFLTFSND